MKDFFQVLKMFCYVHREASDMLSLPARLPPPKLHLMIVSIEIRNFWFHTGKLSLYWT